MIMTLHEFWPSPIDAVNCQTSDASYPRSLITYILSSMTNIYICKLPQEQLKNMRAPHRLMTDFQKRDKNYCSADEIAPSWIS